jgi:cell division cycle 14
MPLQDEPTHHHLFDRMHLVVSSEYIECGIRRPEFCYFNVDDRIDYIGFADDFGPMNLGSIYQYCSILNNVLADSCDKPIAMVCVSDRRSVTNAVFLIGSYLIMELNWKVETILALFDSVSNLLLTYRDVSPGVQNFHLNLEDCWGGLFRAKNLGWIDFGPEGFDLEEYLNYDSPLNGDLHEIVPGKFIAMRGPRDLPSGAAWSDIACADGTFSHRDFSPAHYLDILPQFDVQLVVRLNAPEYDRGAFSAAGIAVADLFFEDCTPPPVDVVAKFLAIAEALPGALAVHCKAGLGRTGTLIALYMMRHHAFTAREAMGWLRIVRPGSVIGEQQRFLCAREALMHRSPAAGAAGGGLRARIGAVLAPGGGAAAVERMVAHVAAAYDARYAAAAAAGRVGGPAHDSAAAAAAAPTPSAAAAGRRKSTASDPGPGGAPAVAAAAAAESAARLAEHVAAAADRRGGARALARGAARGGP